MSARSGYAHSRLAKVPAVPVELWVEIQDNVPIFNRATGATKGPFNYAWKEAVEQHKDPTNTLVADGPTTTYPQKTNRVPGSKQGSALFDMSVPNDLGPAVNAWENTSIGKCAPPVAKGTIVRVVKDYDDQKPSKKPVWRFTHRPPSWALLELIDIQGMPDALSGIPPTGGASYKANIVTGIVDKIDGSENFTKMDDSLVTGTKYNAVVRNIFEVGGDTVGTNIMLSGGFVIGFLVGYTKEDDDNNKKPVYYISPAPDGTLFKVSLTKVSGDNGTSLAPSSYVYDVYTLDGGRKLINATAPERPRKNGKITAPAGGGYCYIGTSGNLILAEAWEIPATRVC